MVGYRYYRQVHPSSALCESLFISAHIESSVFVCGSCRKGESFECPEPNQDLALTRSYLMAQETGLFEAMYQMRAMRRLKPDPVPDDMIRKIIDAGLRAPTGGDV